MLLLILKEGEESTSEGHLIALNKKIVDYRDRCHVLNAAGEGGAGSLHAINYYLYLGHPLIGEEKVTRDGVKEKGLGIIWDQVRL